MPIRIPVRQPSTAATRPLSPPGPQMQQPATSLSQGLEALAQGVGQFAAGVARVKQRTDGMRLDQALSALQAESTDALAGTPDTPGYLSTRGEDAGTTAEAVLERLQKARLRIRDDVLSTDEQRAEFEPRAERHLLDVQGRVMGHQRVEVDRAAKDALEGRKAAVLRAAGAGIGLDTPVAELEQRIRSLQTSPADGKAELDDFKGQLALVTVTQALAVGDVERAERLYSTAKDDLGTHAPQVRNAIDRERLVQTKEGEVADDEKVTADILEKARKPSGFVDPTKARDALPGAGPRFEQRSQLLEHRLRREGERHEQQLDLWRNMVIAADNLGQPVPQRVLLQLNDPVDGDPSFIEGRAGRADRERDERVREARQGTTEGKQAKAAAVQAQLALNKVTFEDFLMRPLEERAVMDVAQEYADLALDDFGKKHLKRLQREAVDRQAKEGLAVDQAEATDVESAVSKHLYERKRGRLVPKFSTEAVDAFRAESRARFEEYRAREGKAPDPEARNAMLSALYAGAVEDPEAWSKKKSIRAVRAHRERQAAQAKTNEVAAAEFAAKMRGPSRGGLLPGEQMPRGPVLVRFPDGSTHQVAADKLPAAMERGGQVVIP